jgi:site-specific recombinase XerD
MSHRCCPDPVVWQPLYAGPLGAHIDTFAHQVVDQGYASWTAKYMMRLLADLSRWLQRHALTVADLNEPRVDDFLRDRYQRYRPHRNDRSVLQRWLEQLRDDRVIPVPVVETDTGAGGRLVCDFQHYLRHQRCLAPTTVEYDLDTVRRFLRERFGTQPLRLEARCAQDVTGFMVQQARRYRPGHAKWLATARRSFIRFLLQHGVLTNDLTNAVPTVPNWRLSTVPKFLNAEDLQCLLQRCDRTTPQGQRAYAILLLLARLG